MEPWIDVIIPTYRPGKELLLLLEKLAAQSARIGKIILINTEQRYWDRLYKEYGSPEQLDKVELHHIGEAEFDHGLTRNLAVSYSTAPYFLCMTQDALPADEYCVENLLSQLLKKDVAAAYARQLPAKDCRIAERYVRRFNYPEEGSIKRKEDMERLGIKTFFCSNVCAAYSREIFDRLGGFPGPVIFNEDMIYAGRAVQAGYGIAYAAKAEVIHSHNYSGRQQFCRNFDLGVSQAEYPEIFSVVSSEKEGSRMVWKTAVHLWRQKQAAALPAFFFQCVCKLMGYRMGKAFRHLPKRCILACTMNKRYWIFHRF